MSAVFRVGLIGIVNKSTKPLAKAKIPTLLQSCGISGKIIRRSQNLVIPKPYPYKDKDYGFIQAVFDKTTKRFDDNSKVKALFQSSFFSQTLISILVDCC